MFSMSINQQSSVSIIYLDCGLARYCSQVFLLSNQYFFLIILVHITVPFGYQYLNGLTVVVEISGLAIRTWLTRQRTVN